MYIPTIGLEIHVELKTTTKMFCACRNDPDERTPNANVCPVCLGHPGTLPVPNEEAIKAVVKVGLALGGTVAEHSHFDRKSYFYPDLPKGYQISQYEEPLVTGGLLSGIRITRIHLEEDTARLVHESSPDLASGRAGSDAAPGSERGSTLVDFNRAGVPLMELVTEPDIKNAEEAVAFARELQRILRYLGASDADMEKGRMRIEANISLMDANVSTNHTNDIREISGRIRDDSRVLGTKVEVKNLNSFRAVHDSIGYEIQRQEKCVKGGEVVVQETRGWNEREGVTESQRTKESAHDYRYFPEPDIPPLNLAGWEEEPQPELPEEKRKRFEKDFGLGREQVEPLIEDQRFAQFFEEVVSELEAKKEELGLGKYQVPVAVQLMPLLYSYLMSDLRGLMNQTGVTVESLKITPEHFAHLIALIARGDLTSRLAKDLLCTMAETGEDPETLMREGGIKVITGTHELGAVVRDIIAANPKPVADYQKGKENALQFLVGQAMAKTGGQASPERLQELFREALRDSSSNP